jgi:hypothetical protein
MRTTELTDTPATIHRSVEPGSLMPVEAPPAEAGCSGDDAPTIKQSLTEFI